MSSGGPAPLIACRANERRRLRAATGSAEGLHVVPVEGGGVLGGEDGGEVGCGDEVPEAQVDGAEDGIDGAFDELGFLHAVFSEVQGNGDGLLDLGGDGDGLEGDGGGAGVGEVVGAGVVGGGVFGDGDLGDVDGVADGEAVVLLHGEAEFGQEFDAGDGRHDGFFGEELEFVTGDGVGHGGFS